MGTRAKLESNGYLNTYQEEYFLGDPKNPEVLLWRACIEEAFRTYNRILDQKARKPLNLKAKIELESLNRFLFEDIESDNNNLVVSLYSILNLISNSPETVLSNIRKIAICDRYKLLTIFSQYAKTKVRQADFKNN